MTEQQPKEIIYVDMDGVIVDLEPLIQKYIDAYKFKAESGGLVVDTIPGLFRDPLPMKDALESVKKLFMSPKYDVYILSTAPWDNPSAWTDKRLWIERYLPFMKKRLILSHNKHLNSGDYLIDDRTKNGASQFKGHHILFGGDKYPNWKSVLDFLQP